QERGVLLLDRRALAGLDEARVAAAAEHREGHAPDVARGRRGRDVEVAVGVEPGDREAGVGVAALEAGHRRGVRGAIAAEQEQLRRVADRALAGTEDLL